MGVFCALLAVAGGALVQLIYGSEYAGNRLAISLAAAAALASALGHPAGYGLLALERAALCFGVRSFALGVTFLTSLCLIGPLGVVGAAAGLLSGSVAGALSLNLAFRTVLSTTPTLAATG